MVREPNKVCPVVLRRSGETLQILVFEHPLAGRQLVKGTIESGESVEIAALRELSEESGIESASVLRHLGTWSSGFEGQIWAFVECTPHGVLPEEGSTMPLTMAVTRSTSSGSLFPRQ